MSIKSQANISTVLLVFIVIFMGATGIFAEDAFVPSLPAIMQHFSTTRALTQHSVAIYFLGYGITLLFYGAWSEKYGRRKILLFGHVVFLLGTLLCIFAPNIKLFLLGRLIEGFGISCTIAMLRAILKESFDDHALARVMSYVSLIFGLVPALAPVLGSYLQHWFNWQGIFVFMLPYAFIAMLIIWRLLPETCKTLDPSHAKFKVMCRGYWQLIGNWPFIGNLLCIGAIYAGMIIYFVLSSFLFQKDLGVSVTEYGRLALLVALAIFASKYLNVILVKRLPLIKVVIIGLFACLFGSMLMLLLAFAGFNVWVVVVPMMIFGVGIGLIFGNCMVLAFKTIDKSRGLAGALYDFAQVFGAFFVIAAVAHVHLYDQFFLAITLVALSLFACGMFIFSLRKS